MGKVKPAKKVVDSDDDDSDDEPPPNAKANAKSAAKKTADSDDDSSDAPPKAKGKPAKKVADDDEEEDSDDEPAPKKKAAIKKAAVDEDEDEAPSAPKKKLDTEGKKGDELTVFVGGIPFSCTEETLKKDFSECGEIEKMNVPMNDEGRPRGIAFITYKTEAGVKEALKYDGEDYGGRRLKVNMAGGKGDKGKGKDKGKDKGKGKGKDNENTVFVRGLPFATTEDLLKKDFAECGDIESLRMPLNDDGQCKTTEGVDKAKAYNETDYGGRTIYVSMAGEGGKGKDGKGKDGKDKGKGKKGKKGKPMSEAKAKTSGAMVESTGKKTSFGDDSDDDEESPPPKKKTKKAPPPEDSDDDDE